MRVLDLLTADPRQGWSGTVQVPLHRLDPELPVPGRARPGDAAVDLHARADVRLEPGERAAVPTGIAVAIPDGWAGLVLPRSGLARRHGIGAVNAPGLIDPGYRGEIEVLLVNHDPAVAFEVRRGDRIAQLLLVPVGEVAFREVDRLPPSERGGAGFGSSGGFGPS